MVLPPPSDGAAALRGKVFGFPVSMHVSFLLLSGLLAFSAGLGIERTLVWLAVVGVSVLVHELGHAFAMRSGGAEPTITLYALGGITRGRMPGTPSRRRQLAVSLAGPAAGIALGGVVFAAAVYLPYDAGGLVEYAIGAALFANIGWGLLNLLPILPLDGGQVLLTLLPGDDRRRLRAAAIVSIVVGAVAAALALAAGLLFAALLAGYFAMGNVGLARGHREDGSHADFAVMRDRYARGDDEGAAAAVRAASLKDPRHTGLAAQMSAAALLVRGEAADARDELLALEPGTVDPFLEAAVLLANGHEDLGRERLRAAIAAPRTTYAVRAATRVLLRRGEDPLTVLANLEAPEAWQAAHEAAYYAGEYGTAAKLGERALEAGHPHQGFMAYNTACSWSMAGNADRALATLRRALDSGWTDIERLDTDPDLEPLRDRPEFAALRAGR